MAEFRFLGVANNGKTVQGVISADSKAEAKKKINGFIHNSTLKYSEHDYTKYKVPYYY